MQALCVLSVLMVLVTAGLAQAGQWRFPVGLAYVSGAHEMTKTFEDNLGALGYLVDDSSEWPVGVAFQPYYLFDSGIGIGGGFGPFMYVRAESLNTDDSYDLYAMPVNLSLRYVFLPSSNISPYIRTGVSYHIAGGDWVKSKEVGFVGGVGVEFFRKNKVGAGIEIAYDSSTITLEKLQGPAPTPSAEKKVKPSEIWVSIFAVF